MATANPVAVMTCNANRFRGATDLLETWAIPLVMSGHMEA
jgi:hypothetical protein